MSDPKELTIVVDPMHLLPQNEKYALQYFQNSKQSPISPSTAGKMFELYLVGHSCSEIRKLNPAYTLGQIVHAKVTYNWDQQREEHINEIVSTARSRVQQSELESVGLMCDMLAAARKMHGDKYKKYLQSGDEKDLAGAMEVYSFRQFKEILEMLLKITGQDVKRVKAEHHHTVDVLPQSSSGPISSEAAADILKKFDK